MPTPNNLAPSPKGFTIYEMPSRPWLYELQQKYQNIKTLIDVPDAELNKLKEQGVDMVWLQGVWSLGNWALENVDTKDPGRLQQFKENLPDYTKEDIIGSPYAIKEYVINPILGGDDALKDFRRRLNERGIKLMLDFVPNHLAVDCTWCSDPAKSSFFVHRPSQEPSAPKIDYDPQGRAHGRDLYSGAWIDTLQLNYWNPALRQAMKETLKKVSSQCDGVRVDMAMLLVNEVIERVWGPAMRANGYQRPPTEFWAEALPEIRKQYPNFYLMAEVYDWPNFTPKLDIQLQQLGFDATYDKTLVDDLAAQFPHLDNLRNYIAAQNNAGVLSKNVHFVENHDEPRALVHFGGEKKASATAGLVLTLPGPRLVWHGQWEGKRNRLLVQLRRAASEPVNSQVQTFYTRLNSVLSSPALHDGTFTPVSLVPEQSNSAWRLVAHKWVKGGERFLVVANLSEQWGDGRIKLAEVTGNGVVKVQEVLGSKAYDRDAAELRNQGLWAVLEPWSVQIFKY